MKILVAIMLSLLLVACNHMPQREPEIITKHVFILKIPPAQTLTIPAPVPDIDLDKAHQSDVARWIASIVERMDTLESQIIEVGKFLSDEQKKLNATK